MVHLDIRPANIFLQSAPSLTPEFNAMSSAESPSGKSLFSTVMASLSQTSLSHDSTSAGQRGGLQRQFSNDEVPSRTTTTSSKSKDTMQKEVEDLILNGHYVLKVGDLGHVRGLFETGFINEGETRYCPRELINSDPSTLDLTKADVFSLAASVYELCLGRYLGSNGDEEMVEWHSIR